MSSTANDPITNPEQKLANQQTTEQDQSIQTKIQAILSSQLSFINDISNEKETFSNSNNQYRLKELNQTIGESIQKMLLGNHMNQNMSHS
ncbi:hypothetical protein PtA15_16A23 [Puccinia triticina]|uniref:Uncharacterized protein n=1 Tax=Puccinia triticina TaxID=208348 RepID=A0ABY7D4T7_9BASI|nr:uncharacterized protein PtA15_16A23 [Puccinia triticina]WAQ92118.1 hypothetical protein PtA15_16A23 [Puccinia triticina]